jgi:hypothetical protein
MVAHKMLTARDERGGEINLSWSYVPPAHLWSQLLPILYLRLTVTSKLQMQIDITTFSPITTPDQTQTIGRPSEGAQVSPIGPARFGLFALKGAMAAWHRTSI